MTTVIPFHPRAEVDAEHRVADFIALARNQLTTLVASAEWPENSWNVSSSFVRKGRPRQSSRLHFFQHGTKIGRGDNVAGIPFSSNFGEFARAYVRYQHSAAPVIFGKLQERLRALGYIEAAFRSLEVEPSIHLLSPNVLTKAVQLGCENLGNAMQYERGCTIEAIYDFCLRHGLITIPFQWHHGIPNPLKLLDRVGREFEKRRAEKLPSSRALEALAYIYRHPRNLRDKLLSAVSLICICTPWRASEVLQLRTDCEVREIRRTESGEAQAYGLRAFPGKGNKPQIKWAPDVTVDQLEKAVRLLLHECSAARAIATWYVENPTRIYLPPELAQLREKQWLTTNDIVSLWGITNNNITKLLRIKGVRHRISTDDGKSFEHRSSDFERLVLTELPRDFPYQNGLKTHPYHEALILARRGALRAATNGNGSRVMFEAIDVQSFIVWLSGKSGYPPVFERYGFTEEDGSPIKITTHSFRHWNNTLGFRMGLSQEDVALWSGRDPGQNKYYDHQTPTEFREELRKLALQAGVVGSLSEAADNLPEPKLISRKEFLLTQIGSAHVTEFGACIHDYALQPCQNHGDCLTCEENVFVKGDQRHREKITGLLELTEMQLAKAKADMFEGDYGADIWVQEHTRKIKRMQLMLAKHNDPEITDGMVVTLPSDRQDSEIEQAMRQRDEHQRNRAAL
jgi:hypothetical protein